MSKKETKLERLYSELYDDRDRAEKSYLGRVLTIVDASIADQEQRKAIKDLIKNAYYGTNEVSKDYCWMRFELANFGKALGLDAWFMNKQPSTPSELPSDVVNKYEELPKSNYDEESEVK